MPDILVSLHGRKIGLDADNKLIMSNASGTLVAVANPDAPLKPAAAQADSAASDVAGLKTDFNALLAKLRAAGLLANS